MASADNVDFGGFEAGCVSSPENKNDPVEAGSFVFRLDDGDLKFFQDVITLLPPRCLCPC